MSRYYTIVTQEQLNSTLPEQIIDYMGYSNSGITLGESHIGSAIELEDGNFLISIQLSNPCYLKNRCTRRFINDDELDFVYIYYGKDNIITDISTLKIKYII